MTIAIDWDVKNPTKQTKLPQIVANVFKTYVGVHILCNCVCLNSCRQMFLHHKKPSSSQAKGTKSTSFLTHVRNEVDLVPLGLRRWSNRLFES